MPVMVTGGSGFIGSRIVRKLVERGQQVVSFDLAPPRPNMQPLLDKIAFYKGDVTQMPQLLEAARGHGVTRVIHMAALLPPESEEPPERGMRVNVQGTNNVFELARWAGLERVVYASSISCYGGQEAYGQRPVTEEDPTNPANVYGMTKVANDFSAASYSRRYGLDIRGIRICTVFGHGRTTGATGLIGGLLISNPAVGKSVELPFRREEPLSMINVEDAAELFVRTALSDALRHPLYLTGGHLTTLGEMADLVRSFIPHASITLGEATRPHVHLVDNSLMLADIGYEMPPLRRRILDQINEARLESNIELIPYSPPPS
ncbi:MAG: NAD-dependent epimerase/dehydratase family protein [Nitrospinota bacterium]